MYSVASEPPPPPLALTLEAPTALEVLAEPAPQMASLARSFENLSVRSSGLYHEPLIFEAWRLMIDELRRQKKVSPENAALPGYRISQAGEWRRLADQPINHLLVLSHRDAKKHSWAFEIDPVPVSLAFAAIKAKTPMMLSPHDYLMKGLVTLFEFVPPGALMTWHKDFGLPANWRPHVDNAFDGNDFQNVLKKDLNRGVALLRLPAWARQLPRKVASVERMPQLGHPVWQEVFGQKYNAPENFLNALPEPLQWLLRRDAAALGVSAGPLGALNFAAAPDASNPQNLAKLKPDSIILSDATRYLLALCALPTLPQAPYALLVRHPIYGDEAFEMTPAGFHANLLDFIAASLPALDTLYTVVVAPNVKISFESNWQVPLGQHLKMTLVEAQAAMQKMVAFYRDRGDFSGLQEAVNALNNPCLVVQISHLNNLVSELVKPFGAFTLPTFAVDASDEDKAGELAALYRRTGLRDFRSMRQEFCKSRWPQLEDEFLAAYFTPDSVRHFLAKQPVFKDASKEHLARLITYLDDDLKLFA